MSCTITVAGNLGRNATYSDTVAGPMTKFSIAASKKQKDGSFESVWFDVACFKYTAQNTMNLEKGQRVLVTGQFWPRTYTGKDGTTKTSYNVTANEVYILERKKVDGEFASPAPKTEADDTSILDIPF